jgi:putative transposase
MCLRFVFLLITRLTAWLRLSRREEIWKTAEILILRHQLTVLQRRQPRRPNLNWADRALLATLLSLIPRTRRHRMRLLVTPACHPPEHQGSHPPTGPRETPNGATAGSTASWPASE